MRFHPHVEMISGVVSNQYLIFCVDQVVLIDTGLPRNHNKILQRVKAAGRQDSDLKTLIITHADGDHYGSANAIKAATKATLMTSSVEADAMKKGRSSRELKPKGIVRILFSLIQPFFRSEPTVVDHILSPGQVLPILNGLHVIPTPGHTPGHLSFYLPAEKILFSGDSIIFPGGSPAPSRGANTWDVELAQKSFQQQMELEPKFICGGHGFFENKF